MIDHNKIKDAIDNYFTNTPTAEIIKKLDRHSADRDLDLERENISHKPVNNKDSKLKDSELQYQTTLSKLKDFELQLAELAPQDPEIHRLKNKGS